MIEKELEPSPYFYETIALVTDFSDGSPFAGIMKGVIRKINKKVSVIDLNNFIPPGDIKTAAFEIDISADYFEKTLFVCVVDPGVATAREILFAEGFSNGFLAPDNGILSYIFERKKMKLFKVDRRRYAGGRRTTFDGRDVFAPAAAEIAMGVRECLAERFEKKIKRIILPEPKIKNTEIICEIIYVDSFGNCWTNFKACKHKIKKASSGGISVTKMSNTYAPSGKNVMLYNSFGFLEFALPDGNFAEKYGIKTGMKFKLYPLSISPLERGRRKMDPLSISPLERGRRKMEPPLNLPLGKGEK
ncbi:MAG: hypothetical protein COT16_01080 [Elusimicrobia bacterium CG08_land_8_20_14_0_20_44_26]|nr:MAG: hypothetical protein COT16_01080 [Elusimicrobia bacterium CG08_land_8_20_14_0_20_44_26]